MLMYKLMTMFYKFIQVFAYADDPDVTAGSQPSHKEVFLALEDRLCGLVVRVLGYRSGGPGSIPGTTRKKN
jgi:hypothetical protein